MKVSVVPSATLKKSDLETLVRSAAQDYSRSWIDGNGCSVMSVSINAPESEREARQEWQEMLDEPGSIDSIGEAGHQYGFNNLVEVDLNMDCDERALDNGMNPGHEDWPQYHVWHNGRWKYIDSGW